MKVGKWSGQCRLGTSLAAIIWILLIPIVGLGRDPLRQPFHRESIWNMPIGSEARYVHARIQKATQRGMTVDEDLIVLTPDAPRLDIYRNDAGWNRNRSRCTIDGDILFRAPIRQIDMTSRWDDRTVLANPYKGWYHHYPDNHVNKHLIGKDADLLEFPGMDPLYLRLAGQEVRDFTLPAGNRTWMPSGAKHTFTEGYSLQLPPSMAPGTYTLGLKLYCPEEDRDVRLALAPSLLDEHGYYRVCSTQVVDPS